MSALLNPPFPPCPECGQDLTDADIVTGPSVPADRDPDGQAKLEIVVCCYHCESEFYAFVPVCELQKVAS